MNIDETHDPSRRSWVESANDLETDFPIQNLPLGVFSTDGADRRPGVAIGASIVDLKALSSLSLLPADLAALLNGKDLDELFASGVEKIGKLRRTLGDLLDRDCDRSLREKIEQEALTPIDSVQMHAPTSIRSFSDYYAGIYHALEAGRLTKADPLLPPSYTTMPLGYNGRASTVQVSGGNVRRPLGQRLVEGRPQFGASLWLDFELELGAFIAGSNAVGDPVPISKARDRIAGICLLNDWSARDLQLWEMAPLGPINSKGFSTSISPWIVTQQALAPFRCPAMDRIESEFGPSSYLLDRDDQLEGGLDIKLYAYLSTAKMRESGAEHAKILESNAQYLYWTFAQMVAQQGCGGTNLCPGDLIGSGTISGPTREMLASLVELTSLGQEPINLPNGEKRSFLEDGDEVILSGRCEKEGFVSIGFGHCVGRITPAPPRVA